MFNLNLMCDVISHTKNEIVIKANENTGFIEDEAYYIIEKLGDEGSLCEIDGDIAIISL